VRLVLIVSCLTDTSSYHLLYALAFSELVQIMLGLLRENFWRKFLLTGYFSSLSQWHQDSERKTVNTVVVKWN